MSDSDNISTPQGSTHLSPDMTLDERLYDLTNEERSFFRQQTGIQDEDELKAHIVQVQAEAYKVCNCESRQSQHETHAWLGLKTGLSLPLHPPLPFCEVSHDNEKKRGGS